MYRSLMLAALIATATAAPLQAQGWGHGGGNGNRKETRTYVDARGRECRETTHYKQNGRDKYDVKCKAPKGRSSLRRDDVRDYRDCSYRTSDGRCVVVRDRRYPDWR